jgi:hypothetical protein
MNEDETAMRTPRFQNSWNWNTVSIFVGFAGMLVLGGIAWGSSQSSQQKHEEWIKAHEQLHKERLVDVKAVEARTEERFRGIDADVRKITNLEYRLTVSEQSTLSVVESVKTLQEIVNRQGSDIRLALEILQRMEANGRAAR